MAPAEYHPCVMRKIETLTLSKHDCVESDTTKRPSFFILVGKFFAWMDTTMVLEPGLPGPRPTVGIRLYA